MELLLEQTGYIPIPQESTQAISILLQFEGAINSDAEEKIRTDIIEHIKQIVSADSSFNTNIYYVKTDAYSQTELETRLRESLTLELKRASDESVSSVIMYLYAPYNIKITDTTDDDDNPLAVVSWSSENPDPSKYATPKKYLIEEYKTDVQEWSTLAETTDNEYSVLLASSTEYRKLRITSVNGRFHSESTEVEIHG